MIGRARGQQLAVDRQPALGRSLLELDDRSRLDRQRRAGIDGDLSHDDVHLVRGPGGATGDVAIDCDGRRDGARVRGRSGLRLGCRCPQGRCLRLQPVDEHKRRSGDVVLLILLKDLIETINLSPQAPDTHPVVAVGRCDGDGLACIESARRPGRRPGRSRQGRSGLVRVPVHLEWAFCGDGPLIVHAHCDSEGIPLNGHRGRDRNEGNGEIGQANRHRERPSEVIGLIALRDYSHAVDLRPQGVVTKGMEYVRGRQLRRRPRCQAGLEPVPGARCGGKGPRGRIGVPVHAEGRRNGLAAQVAHMYNHREGHVSRHLRRIGGDLLDHQVRLRQPMHLQRDRHGVADGAAVGQRGQPVRARRRR